MIRASNKLLTALLMGGSAIALATGVQAQDAAADDRQVYCGRDTERPCGPVANAAASGTTWKPLIAGRRVRSVSASMGQGRTAMICAPTASVVRTWRWPGPTCGFRPRPSTCARC